MKTDILIEGLYFGEGPRWHEGRLWFSDFYDHKVKSVDAAGRQRVELELDDQPSGLGWLPDGRLLLVAMKQRKVKRLDPGGLVDHADLTALTVYRCNDMVVDGNGRAYVGNFGFDLEAEFAAADGALDYANLPTTNLVRVDPDGSVQVASAQMRFPNGAVITADGRTLIIAESTANCLTAFTIARDGTLQERRLWASLDGVTPDGICLDAQGRVWVANAFAAECLLISEGGRVVQRVETSQPCFACMLGGADGRTLFTLTAADADGSVASSQRTGKIEKVQVAHQRAGWP
jgi:sugar lactone lactonase YvrE